jgi:hypothetical protein
MLPIAPFLCPCLELEQVLFSLYGKVGDSGYRTVMQPAGGMSSSAPYKLYNDWPVFFLANACQYLVVVKLSVKLTSCPIGRSSCCDDGHLSAY